MRGSWFQYDRFAVWGLGRSGIAASNLLASRGKTVLATDPGKNGRPAGIHADVEFMNGANQIRDAEVVVVSPGLKPSNPVFETVPVNVPVVSEIEIGWAATDVPFLGITGTDGKTTTTEMLTHILQHAGRTTVAAGNIGVPICEVVAEREDLDLLVTEVSAFQLWTTHDFSVAGGVYTNLAPDHLDYFDGWDAYVASKHEMTANSADAVVAFNWDDPLVRGWGATHPGRVLAFSTKKPPTPDAVDQAWWLNLDTDEGDIFVDGTVRFTAAAFAEHGIFGEHNMANFMGAAAIAHDRGVSFDTIREAMTSFRVGAHRVEFCGECDGVAFYDDSKATNANAALAGIRALPAIRPVGEQLVVIAGGVDKGIELDELAATLSAACRKVVLIGEIRERFASALSAQGFDSFVFAESMEHAVATAFSAAKPGAAVLLSPACSSFDMFDSYADRGDQFQRAVAELA